MNPECTIERRKAIQLGGAIALGTRSAFVGTYRDSGPPKTEPTGHPELLPPITGRNHIFGYGSLIQRESRTSTWPEAEKAAPAVVRGISRGWYDRMNTASWGPTYLGAVPMKGATCNGVVFSVTPEELRAFARRESGYRLTRIPSRDIAMLDGSKSPPAGTVWYFANVNRRYPSDRFPIVQSYVDVCLDGCLENEESYPEARESQFAKEFIRTTSDWQTPWFNDRIYPWRPFVYIPRANAIDTLLRDELGEKLFDEITLPRR
ncbi:gamma-glutamylcyclotransferase family protein [Streptomyces sp. NBC_00316]|uniref:gamma-glutamylcyclotransferase family protein n=1 Tax=Streptomyces sp. NBC_00316 TaxID=2975710 RepID=UPI002E2854E6|nr:gamma-glutamylcyclotransferase family protein [Streptomyces sp. NBC_00316]